MIYTKVSINKIFFLIVATLLLQSGACTKSDPYSDPELVALEFWTAIQNKNVDAAAEHIYLPVRKHLSNMIRKDILINNQPPLPEKLEFEISIDGERAVAKILNSEGVGVDLFKAEGRWWVN
jgi:hypothetical protein